MDFTDKIPVLQEQRRQGHSLLRRSRTLLPARSVLLRLW